MLDWLGWLLGVGWLFSGPPKPSPTPENKPQLKSGCQRFLEQCGATGLPHTTWNWQILLSLTVYHQLQFQHRWTELRLHTHSPLAPHERLSRPMLSGLPPKRLYVHPDEQIEHLRREDARKKRKAVEAKESCDQDQKSDPAVTENGVEEDELRRPVREWVLPTHLREPWSLKRLGDAFDGISNVPPVPDPDDDGVYAKTTPDATEIPDPGKWRQTKRLVIAIRDTDSTVMYYIVHDGIVKPRQN